jgi:hypothetical protein
MEDRGFEYVPYPPNETAPISMADLYGTIEMEQAETFGYHNPRAQELVDAEKRVAEVDVMTAAQGAAYFTALYGDTNSCRSSANLDLYGTEIAPDESAAAVRVLEIAGETLTRVNSAPQFADAAGVWRTCMNNLGHNVEVLSDTRMRYQTEPTDTRPPSTAEVNLAVADAGCRRDADLDRVIVGLYNDVFAELLEDHQGVVEELQAAFDRGRLRALELTGGN